MFIHIFIYLEDHDEQDTDSSGEFDFRSDEQNITQSEKNKTETNDDTLTSKSSSDGKETRDIRGTNPSRAMTDISAMTESARSNQDGVTDSSDATLTANSTGIERTK